MAKVNLPATDSSLSDELKKLLEERLLEARSNPKAGIPWEEVKARLLRRHEARTAPLRT
ncbi:MAG TPA: addiction module protein [Thermoanaerobaculia bacterium]|nr:addiction module protein [Thermoanaerobaculia bacterium]